MLIKWDPELETGNTKIDDDHRHIIEMINGIWDKLDTPIGQACMEDMMLDYCNYCSKHFHFEEGLMVEYKYQGYKAHRNKHKLMLDAFESMMLRLEVAKEISADQLRSFVKMIADHIQTEDHKLANFVRHHAAASREG